MELNLDQSPHPVVIKSYQPGLLTLTDKSITHSVMVTPHHVFPFPAQTVQQLSAGKLEHLNIKDIQVILIGTGEISHPIPLAWFSNWTKQGIGVEVMSTAAACRTFSLLANENRSVLAILLIQ